MSDWTPTETTVRVVFGEGMAGHGQTPEQAHESFDRWLTAVKAEAFKEGYANASVSTATHEPEPVLRHPDEGEWLLTVEPAHD